MRSKRSGWSSMASFTVAAMSPNYFETDAAAEQRVGADERSASDERSPLNPVFCGHHGASKVIGRGSAVTVLGLVCLSCAAVPEPELPIPVSAVPNTSSKWLRWRGKVMRLCLPGIVPPSVEFG